MPFPTWLPQCVNVNPWTSTTFEVLAEIYARTIATGALRLDNQRVWYYTETDGDHEVMFWHLTHRKNKATGERLPDLARCEKLSWVAAIIANADQPEVTRWDYLESDGNTNTYLWLCQNDCLVLLRKYPDGHYRLITAYHVDSGTRRSLSGKQRKAG
jgi:hypothetical protein